MDTPPEFRPPRRSGPSAIVIVLIVLACLCVCCGGGLALMGYFGMRTGMPVAKCAINLSLVQRALFQYAGDHDGLLPPAATWQDAIEPYYRTAAEEYNRATPIAKIDLSEEVGCEQGTAKTGFVFNTEVAGKKLEELEPVQVLVFESDQRGRNLTHPYEVQRFEASPKIMNEPRGWYVLRVHGGAVLIGRGGVEQTMDMGSRQ